MFLESFDRAFIAAGLPEPAFVANRRRPSRAWCEQRLRHRSERVRRGEHISIEDFVRHEFIPIAGGTASFTLTLDTTAPQGASISINSGAAYATSQNVTLAVTTSDTPTTGYQMKIWGDVDTADNANIQATEGASTFITYSATQAVKLSSGDGNKDLHCKIRDDVWNTTSQLDDSITLDTTLPVATISVAVSPAKISKIATKDTATFQFQADTHIQAWKVKVVSASGSLENTGTQIPTTAGSSNVTGGALAATTNQTVTIKGTDLETAGAEGANIVKVFVQDDAGNWSI